MGSHTGILESRGELHPQIWKSADGEMPFKATRAAGPVGLNVYREGSGSGGPDSNMRKLPTRAPSRCAWNREDRRPEPGRGAVLGRLVLVTRVWGGLAAFYWRGQGRELAAKLERELEGSGHGPERFGLGGRGAWAEGGQEGRGRRALPVLMGLEGAGCWSL